MSGPSGIVAPGIMAGLIGNASVVRRKLDTLTEQASSGLVSQTYAGLGAGTRAALDLKPALAHQQVWQANIDAAAGRMQVAQSAMTQIQSIATDFRSQLNNLNGLTPSQVDSVAASARQALQQVAGLLDSTNGPTYVFAGQDSANPPMPSPDQILTSGFYTQIASAVGGLAANGAAATSAATLAVASSNAPGTSPFSASQSQPAAAVRAAAATIEAGDGLHATVGLQASANTYVASTGPSTTGSAMRDLMRGLATLGAMSGSQASAAGFAALVSDTRDCLTSSVTALAGEAGGLGNAQSALAQQKTELAGTAAALTTQVSNAEDVDVAQTLTDLSTVQTQLQTSYQLIAGLRTLTLSQYLTAA